MAQQRRRRGRHTVMELHSGDRNYHANGSGTAAHYAERAKQAAGEATVCQDT